MAEGKNYTPDDNGLIGTNPPLFDNSRRVRTDFPNMPVN